MALTTDRGYIFVPNNLGGDNRNFMDWCREHNVLLLHPFRFTFVITSITLRCMLHDIYFI